MLAFARMPSEVKAHNWNRKKVVSFSIPVEFREFTWRDGDLCRPPGADSESVLPHTAIAGLMGFMALDGDSGGPSLCKTLR